MVRINLTVIGGGSVNWMKDLMRDVYLLEEIEGGRICLVDPNLEYANAVKGMLETFNRLRGKKFSIFVTDERRQALPGSDFVMTTFSPVATTVVSISLTWRCSWLGLMTILPST